MARIELSNIGGGGGGGSTTLALTTTGTSGASVLTTVPGGYSLNIPVYQGALSLSTSGTSGASTLVGNTLTIPTYQGQISLTTTGTSGASTFVGNTLNIPTYQGAISLTTTGTSGAATLVGNTLNVPQYSTAPAGSTGEIQYNNAGAFGASANLSWVNSPNPQLNIGAPLAPTGRLNVRGGGTTSSTVNLRLTDSGNTELFKILDNGSTNIGTGFNWDNTNRRLGIGTSSPSALLTIDGDITGSGVSPILVTRTGVSSADAFFLVGNGTNTAGQFLPQFLLRSNFLAGGSAIGGFIGGQITSTSTGDIGLIFDGRLKTNSAMTQGWLYSFRGYTTDYIRVSHNGNTVLQSGDTFTDNGYRLDIISASSTHALRVRAPNASSGTNALLVQNTTVSDLYKIEANGKISYLATNTAAGTTGAQTINRPSGTVNFAAGATSLVVTNSLCTTASIVLPVIRTNDATAQIKNVVPGAGSFTINLSAAATAETSVGFFIIN